MKIDETFVVDAALERVWSAIVDPSVVGPCIPNCTDVEVLSPHEYKARIRVAVGPVHASFNVVVAVTDRIERERMTMTTRGEEGSRASMLGAHSSLAVRALDERRTEVHYESEVSLTGRLGKFGLGLMKKKAADLGAQFAERFAMAVTKQQSLEERVRAYPPQEPLSALGAEYGAQCLRNGAGIAYEEAAYGADPYQSIAIVRPARPDGRVAIFWHGGGWTSGYKEWMLFQAPAMIAAGITFVSPGYRLAPQHLFPAGIDDAIAAIAWVHANVRAPDGSAPRIFIGGHSAGGHYAALLAVRRDWQAKAGLPVEVVRGCLPISGVYQFTEGSGLTNRPRFLGPPELGNDRAASPMHQLQAPLPPFLVAYGTNDFPHLIPQAERFVEALRAAGGVATGIAMTDRTHFSAHYAGGEPDGPWMPHALAFMERHA